jgi:gliding motility-associated-like protein
MPYEYKLGTGSYQASGTFSALSAGSYIVTVRDAALNTFNVPVIITEPTALTGLVSVQTSVLCFGGNTGSVTVTGSGGVAPYMYKLDAGSYQASGSYSSLVAGAYTITVQDANLCTFAVPVSILQPSAVLAATIVSQANVSCSGLSDGSVTVNGTGGTAPYQYSIDGSLFQSSGTFASLKAGNYTLTIHDASLCSATVTVTLTQPEALSVASDKNDASCPSVPDGSITLTITGGTQPYNVIWSDGVASANRLNTKDGTYSAVITDANGCATSIDVTVGVTGSEACLEIQQVITPNNDGYNDTWKIRNIDLFPNAEVFVYTRWGKLVFNSRNISADEWDGRYKGELLPTDSYHYILHLNNGSEPRSGVVSIIR